MISKECLTRQIPALDNAATKKVYVLLVAE